MDIFKAHGTGNDFVVVPDPDGAVELTAEAVVALCDRRFGLGADGVLRLAPAAEAAAAGHDTDGAHVFMDYRNGGDGAPVEMCGNGVRVVARHLHDHGWTTDTTIRIATRAGVRTAELHLDDSDGVTGVTVDMGPPSFAPAALPLVDSDPGEDGWHHLEVDGVGRRFLPVSMGNPHAVLLVDEPADAPVTTLGPRLETHEAFPKGTNVEFVAVRDRTTLDLRVWERGVGETLACGTGVCGAVAALVRSDHLDADQQVTVRVPGGTLVVEWNGQPEAPVLMTGPAVEVARVTLHDDWARRHGLPTD